MELVLDNNVFFAIMNPKSISAYLFASIKANFIAPEFIKLELIKYKEECLSKSKLSEQEFEMRRTEIEKSIKFFKEFEYDAFLINAILALSDPSDSPYLALALMKKSSIWSNDSHLNKQSLVKVYTTSDLIESFLEGTI